jgi:glycosyltransferase involved in cell wall biosynthesis
MNKPLVSILIPAYNCGGWIAETLASAVAQTWPNKEIIVVDDGSSDNTRAIVAGFASQGVRLHVQTNAGAAAARNRALELSSGEYIQWLDADDLLARRKIESQMAVLQGCGDPRRLASGPWAYFYYRPHRAKFVPTPLWHDLSPTEWLVRKMGLNLHMQTATWLVARELCDAAGPWNTRLLSDDDGEYFCRVLLKSTGVRFVDEARVFYRASGPTSLSYLGRSLAKLEAQFHSMQLHIGYLRALEDSERVRAACVKYLGTWLPEFHPDSPDLVRRVRALAVELGGTLELPRFSAKYAWLDSVAGPSIAKRTQVSARRARWAVERSVDRFLARAEGRFRRPASAPAV